MTEPQDWRVDVIGHEQLAAQIVALMDAHFKRPQGDEKRYILSLAAQQISAQEQAIAPLPPGGPMSQG